MTEHFTLQHTERLIIRRLTLTDIDTWKKFLSNEEATKHFPENYRTAEKAEWWIKNQLERYQVNGYGLMALESKLTGELIGQCGLLDQEVDGVNEVEIGYHVMPEYWAKGYATEAARFFKWYAFRNDIAKSVISIIHPENVGSQMVASRNGMTKEKTTIWKGGKAYIYRANK